MAIKLADVFVPITGDNSALRRTLDSTRTLLTGWVRSVSQGIGQGIGQGLFNLIGNSVRRATSLIGESIKATSDLGESVSKTGVAFGTSANDILNWSKTSAAALGQSQQQALEAAASFGLLFQAMGTANDESARLSKAMVELATDMASINNVSIDEALVALRAGLIGETEPLRRFGVLLSAAAVEAEALNSGLVTNKNNITEQQKVQARYNIIMRQTVATQGDYQRTLSGIANQERFLEAQRKDALASIGAVFAPLYLTILTNLNKIIQDVSPYGVNIVRSLAEGLVSGVIFLLPALRTIRDTFVYWLQPGSPPRLLPELVKWGASAMNEYLGGWGQADFGILERLGGTIEGILRSYVASGAIGETEIVDRVFGSRRAIASAINEWNRAGQVTTETLLAIQNAAGPAGFSLAGIVKAYFDLEASSRTAAQAQRELNSVTEQYERTLRPLNQQLDEITEKQNDLRDRQRLSALRRTVRDPSQTANERRLALLEIEEIQLRDQIRGVESERKVAIDAATEKLQAAQKQQEVAEAIYGAQQALLDQQVKTNQLVGEENQLREQQAAQAEALYQAMLQYNMALADTEGKIALMRLELARTEKGSIEYYGILSQIAGLEETLKNERGQPIVDPASVLPNLSDLDVEDWVKELSNKLNKAIEDAFGLRPPPVGALIGPMEEGDFRTMLDFANEGPKELPIAQGVKDFVDSLKELVAAIQGLTPPLTSLASTFGEYGQEAEEATEKADTSIFYSFGTLKALVERDWPELWRRYYAAQAGTLEEATIAQEAEHLKSQEGFTRYLGVFQGYIDDGWQGAWNAYVGIQKTALDNSIENNRNRLQWLMDLFPSPGGGAPTDATSPLGGLEGAGESIISMIWAGMQNEWANVSAWWNSVLTNFRDFLPFSEPRNPNSPLAGLAMAGEAIIKQIQLGVDGVMLELPEANRGLLTAGASSIANTTSNSRTINVQPGAIVMAGQAAPEEFHKMLEDALSKLFTEVVNA